MNRKIYKGMHYCLSFLNFIPRLINDKYDAEYKVSFNNTCAYNIGDDQSDINKLFGVSYGYHHNQSDRIGWRYKETSDKRQEIEILLYSYENGYRYTTLIDKISIGDVIYIQLTTKLHKGYRNVVARVNHKKIDIMLKHKKTFMNWGYTLGSFFGGNKTAPHTIKFFIKHTKK
jgi:hypothetical protein